ncbi:MAG: hypothetical protein WAV82_08445 [Methylobacter sp.]
MKKTTLLSAILFALSAVPAMADDVNSKPDAAVVDSTADKNGAGGADFSAKAADADAKIQDLFDKVKAQLSSGQVTAAIGNLCAIAVIPGPATSFEIRYGIFNVIAPNLDFVIIDTFRALGGQSLLTESVFGTVPPSGGTLTDLYPGAAAGKGPIVLGFTNFGSLESTSFSTDPDTYDDPNFGATVLQMDNTNIEAVYNDGKRCQGALRFNATFNASIAALVQVHP